MTTIENGNLKCLRCGAVHLVVRPISAQRLHDINEAFNVLHDDCRGKGSVAQEKELTVKDYSHTP